MLNVFEIRIPPLRERRDDIPLLAAGFLREFGATAELTTNAMDALCCHDWPGNVRELRIVLARAMIVCDGRFIAAEDQCLLVRAHSAPIVSTNLRALERQAIERALREPHGNKVKAAEQLAYRGCSSTVDYRSSDSNTLDRSQRMRSLYGRECCAH